MCVRAQNTSFRTHSICKTENLKSDTRTDAREHDYSIIDSNVAHIICLMARFEELRERKEFVRGIWVKDDSSDGWRVRRVFHGLHRYYCAMYAFSSYIN